MSQKLIKIREGFNVTPLIPDSENILYINNNENLNNVNGSPVLGNPKRCFNPNSDGFSWNDVVTFLGNDSNQEAYYIKFIHSVYSNVNMPFYEIETSRYFIVDCDNSTFEDSTFTHAIFTNIYRIQGNSICENAQITTKILAGTLTLKDESGLGSIRNIILNVSFIDFANLIFGSNNQEYIDINIGNINQYLDISGDVEYYVLNKIVNFTIRRLDGSLYIHDFPTGYALFRFSISNCNIMSGDTGRNQGIVLNDVAGGDIEFNGNMKIIHGSYPLFTFTNVRTGLNTPILRLNNVDGYVVTNNLISLNSSTCSMNIINSTIATTQYLYTAVSSSFSIYTRNFLTNYTGSSYVGDPKIINTITQDAYLKI